MNGGGGEINYGMCENIFQSILIFGQNISVCSRQIGPRIIGPRTAGPQKVGPGAPDSWAPERCWSPTVRIESRMFNCKHILEIVPSPLRARQGSKTTIKLDNSPKCLHKNQDRIKNVELYTHFRNCTLPSQGKTGPKDNNQT